MVDGHGRPIDLAGQVEAARIERQKRIDAACEIPIAKRESAAIGYRR
jgi:hypothetical protein